MTIEDTVQTAY